LPSCGMVTSPIPSTSTKATRSGSAGTGMSPIAARRLTDLRNRPLLSEVLQSGRCGGLRLNHLGLSEL
jgi:hypothetical protein